MATKDIGIKLTARDRVSRVVRGIGSATEKTTSAFLAMGVRGARAVENLTQKFFFLTESIRNVQEIARSLFETFITPAVQARKYTQSLVNVFGQGTYEKIRGFSKETGLAFDSVATAALNMGQTVDENGKLINRLDLAGGLDKYLAAIQRVADYRPDLGAEGAIAMVDGIIGRMTEATEATEKGLGQYTSVVTGGVAGQVVDLEAELDKLGVIPGYVDESATALDRLREKWREFAATVGGRVLDKLAEGAIKLLEWLEKNEGVVLRLTDRFTDWVNQGLQGLITWLDSDGPERLIETFHEIANAVERIAKFFAPVMQGLGRAQETIANPQAQGKGAFRRAVGATVARPKMAAGRAIQNLRMAGTVGAYGVGRFFRGERFAQRAAKRNLGSDMWGLNRAARQQVDVRVSVDNEGGLRAYTKKEIGRNNDEMVRGWNSGAQGAAWSTP